MRSCIGGANHCLTSLGFCRLRSRHPSTPISPPLPPWRIPLTSRRIPIRPVPDVRPRTCHDCPELGRCQTDRCRVCAHGPWLANSSVPSTVSGKPPPSSTQQLQANGQVNLRLSTRSRGPPSQQLMLAPYHPTPGQWLRPIWVQ